MYYVYVLYLYNKNNYYAGYTKNLKRRINEHKSGSVKSTKNINEAPKLVFYEAFINKEAAIRREHYFKTTQGKRMLKILLK